MQSLIHIQGVHDIPLKKFPLTFSPGTKRPIDLTAFHLSQIGLYALNNQYYHLAIEWIEQALDKVVNRKDQTIPLVVLENYLELVVKAHNDNSEISEDWNPNFFHENVTIFPPNRDRIKRSTLQLNHFKGMKADNYVAINFWGLCSGENYQTEIEKSKLYCWYDHSSNPAWFINPLKKELLSESPKVIQTYNFLGDQMIAKIIQKSQTSLKQSEVFGTDQNRIRTSVTAWIDIQKEKEQIGLVKKMEYLTGFNIQQEVDAEKLQIVEYTYGRYYTAHPDALETYADEYEERLGDRVATVLFYLNDVPAGGLTPFCNAGTFALPLKGSVVIWENLYRNGTPREDVWHGSCPVIYGHKIVANQWIRYNSQYQKFQCTLNQNE